MKNEPLYKQIMGEIKKQIQSGRLRPGDRVPSEKELAEQFHVSQITTKNALTGLAEEEIVIRIKGKGTFVREDSLGNSFLIHTEISRGIIGLIIPNMKTKIEQEFVNYIEKYTNKCGYNLLLKITRESQTKETEAIEEFRRIGVKAMIIFPTEKEVYNESVLRLTLEKFPLVLIDRYMENILSYSVSSQNMEGTFEAISYLLEKGHRNIGLVTPKITNTTTFERAEGFEKAFLNRNLTINKNLWCTLDFSEISPNKTPQLIKKFIEERDMMTAIFVMNAELANYTNTAIKGINQLTRNIELISFDPTGIEGIAYVEQNIDDLSKAAVNLITAQIEGEYDPRRIFIPVNLNIKDSVCSSNV